MTAALFEPEEPLIERLAEAARRKPEQPTAGSYAIERAQEPDVEVPPECMLYEEESEEYIKFELDKMPPHGTYTKKEPSSTDVEELKKETNLNIAELQAGLQSIDLNDLKEAQGLADDQGNIKEQKSGLQTGDNASGKDQKEKKGSGRFSIGNLFRRKASKGKRGSKSTSNVPNILYFSLLAIS
jgi:hypothetical protein